MEKPTSFANDILPLFTPLDIKSMAWFCDLTSYDDVKTNAPEILNRLNGIGGAVMPPPPSKGGAPGSNRWCGPSAYCSKRA